MKEFRIHTLAELRTIISPVYGALHEASQHHSGAWVLALHGDLGAGKTTFVQMLVEHISDISAASVTSPTFVIMKRYEPLTPEGLKALVHVDAYRIEDPAEMKVLHFEDLLADHQLMICVEWAEKIAPLLPAQTLHLSFAIEGEERIITLADGHQT